MICDKPLCLTVEEAKELKALAEKGGLILCLTHNYSGYAMVRHAARMVRNGDLGEIKVVQAEHASGWAAKLLEKQGHTQAAWRMDPGLLGDASVLYDLGTHAHQLTRFITGLEVSEVAAELSQIVAGRAIKDNANLLLRFSNGARGSLWASMAAVGNEHGLRIRVYGDRGSLAWHQEDPHHLQYSPIDGPPQILAQGAAWLSPDADKWTRAGLGTSGRIFEAFANLYTEVADALLAKAEGRPFAKAELGFPDATDGLQGVAFVEAAMRSYAAEGAHGPRSNRKLREILDYAQGSSYRNRFHRFCSREERCPPPCHANWWRYAMSMSNRPGKLAAATNSKAVERRRRDL